jgi:predicted N-acyltransferase
MLDLHTHPSVRDIPEPEWDALLGPDPEPYLRWRFLEALEATGCARPEVGWAPLFLTLRREGELVAAVPAYVKGNSEGEFVFDHGWAEFAYGRLGVEYYPKLVVACPFTPATGPRLLIRASEDAEEITTAFARGTARLVEHLGLSSAHVLFPRRPEAERLEAAGLCIRSGVQYHWHNRGYASFDDFLGRYNAKRRHQIRRERSEMVRQGIALEVLSGKDIGPAVVDHVFDFYCATVTKYLWGRQYLSRAFFEEVCARMPEQLLVVLARETASNRVLGGAFNLVGGQRLFGRYWGQFGEVRFLHFNVCYYQGIEECIRRGLSVFEPGAGGEHKIVRGFEPTLTYSAHHLAHPKLDRAVRDFVRREREAIRSRMDAEPSVFKNEA